MNVAAGVWFDDHHDYALPVDVAQLERLTARRAESRGPLDAWITTLKDWVKLESATASLPIWHVRIASRIAPRSEEALKQTLQRLMRVETPTEPSISH
jgi:tetraacyldisaccharide-1-P 4'-kinase